MATYCHSLPLLVLRRLQTAASWELHEMDLAAYRFLKSLPVFVHMLSCYQFTMTRTLFSAPQCNDSVSLTRGSGLTVGLWNWMTAFSPSNLTTYMWHWHNIKYVLPLLYCIMLYSILKVAEPFYSYSYSYYKLQLKLHLQAQALKHCIVHNLSRFKTSITSHLIQRWLKKWPAIRQLMVGEAAFRCCSH